MEENIFWRVWGNYVATCTGPLLAKSVHNLAVVLTTTDSQWLHRAASAGGICQTFSLVRRLCLTGAWEHVPPHPACDDTKFQMLHREHCTRTRVVLNEWDLTPAIYPGHPRLFKSSSGSSLFRPFTVIAKDHRVAEWRPWLASALLATVLQGTAISVLNKKSFGQKV